MTKSIFMLTIISIILFLLLSGCSKTRIGKVELSDETIPGFLKVGKTTAQEVLAKLGEPYGYQELKSRSAMIYLNYHEDYAHLLVTEIRIEKAFRLDLVFEDRVLSKAEIKKEGWGFDANVDPQLFQLIAR
ncbi:MAG: hypothetical protein H8E38_05225 [SAR324 cluster bacterium]|nr:hypothetical protein [SAR324 cluster bacterium]MBL7034108.1 hypothetical protein [SAR324 cluster bacterium]